ncbi:MAG: ABC transporter ATP-binding protein [Pleurocapsa minor GSE-CHR-MK-17-07R]|nr:ABC transporter ATP-binding protein [Pleurocapsa minor GSE-CHR-MK 17-07R]
MTGFLGPNGAGKTTTMRMLTGYLPPTSGTARVAGFDIFNESIKVRQQVGYLPESVPLYRDMTALGYLMYIAEIRGVKHRRDRAMDVLERVGLAKRADSQIRTLSKGMKQRVGLASTLVHDPAVLILDEPTIGLDPIQVLELRDLVRELGQKHTVLFSTHILSEAEQVCDNLVIINGGNIVAQGAPTVLRGDLERGGRVLVRANAPVEALLPIVRQAEGVSAVEIAQDGVIATPASLSVDPRPAIAAAVVSAGISLTELRPVAVNLEEIFLELTRQAVAVAPAEAAHEESAEVTE